MVEAAQSLGRVILECTGRKPYAFVVMPFDSANFWLFQLIEKVVKTFDCACIHAGHIGASGFDLRTKIHGAIERAELVIAEVSERGKPNVFYELGYACGQSKEMLLLRRRGVDSPSDLGGIECIEYDPTAEPRILEELLRKHLEWRLGSESALLRDMLLGPDPRPAYIVAHPKSPSPGAENPPEPMFRSRIYDERTFGDNLGVLGLLSAFGSIFGELNDVELISAQFAPPDLPDRDVNLYLIASPRVNPLVAKVLEAVQPGREPKWEFASKHPDSSDAHHWLRLWATFQGERKMFEGEAERAPSGDVSFFKTDYGIVVRCPNAGNPRRLWMIMAGAHSIGTGAACLAATRSVLIRQIRDKLKSQFDVDIADKSHGFWALVVGRKSQKDGMLDVQDVAIEHVGMYPKDNDLPVGAARVDR
jgi:hypothetical protein